MYRSVRTTPSDVVRAARLTPRPRFIDQYSRMAYLYDRRSQRVTVMPPSPGATKIDFGFAEHPAGMSYTTKIHPTIEGKLLYKRLPLKQRNHRSRDLAMAWPRLVKNELVIRSHKAKAMAKFIEQYRLDDDTSYQIAMIILQRTKEFMVKNYRWFHKYAQAHKNSSILPGYKWSQFYNDADASVVQHLFDTLCENIENMIAYPDWCNGTEWNVGLRTRPMGLEHSAWRAGSIQTSHIKERDRAIAFDPSMNMYTAFIPDKVRFYAKVYDDVDQVLDVGAPIALPHIMGGAVYAVADEYHGSRHEYHALDARSWDAVVLPLLGKYMGIFGAQILQILQMMSGMTWTSLIGTIGTLVLAQFVKGLRMAIALGDDLCTWGAHDWPSLLEESPLDTYFGYVLGLGYPSQLVGLRFSVDTAAKMESRPFRAGTNVGSVEREYDPATSERWREMYMDGTINGEPIMEKLCGVGPTDYTHGGEVISQLWERGEVGA